MAETDTVDEATDEMRQSIQEVTNFAIQVADVTSEAVQSAEKSNRVVTETINDINKVSDFYEEVVHKVAKLNQEINQANEVVTIIAEIADQTNLLALNTSIEAREVGSMGKGLV